MVKKNRRNRPIYKKFVRLRENVQRRRKLLNFKKQKWQKLISYLNRSYQRFKKRFKLYDLNKYLIKKFNLAYKTRYRYTTHSIKKIKLFYGNLLQKYLKKTVQKTLKTKNFKKIYNNKTAIFLELVEKRLDAALYRAHFALSIATARQMIAHHQIKVNCKTTTNHSYSLKKGDIIEISQTANVLVEKNISNSNLWPLPPKYLQINYKTLQIVFHGDIKNQNMSNYYDFRLDINNLINKYR